MSINEVHTMKDLVDHFNFDNWYYILQCLILYKTWLEIWNFHRYLMSPDITGLSH